MIPRRDVRGFRRSPRLGVVALAAVLGAVPGAVSRASAASGSAAVEEDTGARLDPPTPGVRRDRPGAKRPRTSRTEAETRLKAPKPEEPRRGPHVELSFGTFVLGDGRGGGRVYAGGFAAYFPTRALRLGLRGDLGRRTYRLGGDDVLFRTGVVLGYQHLPERARVAPHVAAVGVLGVVLGQRFDTPFRDRLRGAGLEAGLTLRVGQVLLMGLTLGYVRASLGGLSHNLFEVRLALGL